MDCKKYSDLIGDLVADELDGNLADEVSRHVFACQNCEAEFEKLDRERAIYSQFLFEIEPPKNLSQRFQARLENEISSEKSVLPTTKFSFGERLANIFSFGNPVPIMTGLLVISLFGIGYFWLKNSTSETAKSNNSTAENPKQNLPVSPQNKEFAKEQPKEFQPEIVKAINNPKAKTEKVLFEKTKAVEPLREKVEPIKTQVKKAEIRNNSDVVKTPKTDEEENLRLREIQVFEQETAKQIEKIEMLFRSFRNARFSEETEQYDVAYEKQQARKLLQTNEKLSQQAESFGDFYAKEMFDKVEPFLLDIANLEENPSAEMVLDIKQRFRSQNLIASLQTY